MPLRRDILEPVCGLIGLNHRRQALIEGRITPLQIVTNLVRLDLLLLENGSNRTRHQSGQTGVAGRGPKPAGMAGQKPQGPQFMRIAQALGLGTRLPDQPQPRCLRDLARASGAGQVVQRADSSDRCGSPGAASHPRRMKAEPGCGFPRASARRPLQHDAGTLHMVTGSGARLGECA